MSGSASNQRIIPLEEGWNGEIKAKVRKHSVFCGVILWKHSLRCHHCGCGFIDFQSSNWVPFATRFCRIRAPFDGTVGTQSKNRILAAAENKIALTELITS